MKPALMFTIIVGLLCASSQAAFGDGMESPKPKAPLKSSATVSSSQKPEYPAIIDDIKFFYKIDMDARYLTLKKEWLNANRTEVPVKVSEKLAWQAYQKSDMEKEFDVWLRQGGPHPEVFRAKLHLLNPSVNALLNVKVRITIRAKVGKMLVDPQLLITDYNYLARTAQWKRVRQYTVNVPVLAPGDEMLLPTEEIQVLQLVEPAQYRWPEYILVEAEFPDAGSSSRKAAIIRLIPDHFVTPNF